MGIALLLLGLVPLMFVGDLFGGADEGDGEGDPDASAQDAALGDGDSYESIVGIDTFLLETAREVSTDTIDGGPIKPDDSDAVPFVGDEVDPDSIVAPDESDAVPFVGGDVDPDTILAPSDEPGDGYDSGDGTLLQTLIVDESDLDTGVDWVGDQISETLDTTLADDGDFFDLDTGTGEGEGILSDYDGTPVLDTDGAVHVVAGGAGDDEITTGEEAAYAFGGAGDDLLVATEGAAALFGGDGADTILGGDASLFADGGDGDDLIVGGDQGDVLFGGAHELDDTAQDDDFIDGGAGDDLIYGGQGSDVLIGGDGDDVINHFGSVEEQVGWERHDFDWHIDGDADTLEGGAGNDTLIMDREDTATGGEGMDTFWVYFDQQTGDGFADVLDFETGNDFLKVSLNPDLDYGDMDVDVQPSDDGADSVVTLNGEVVAMLRGAPDATLADVKFEITPNLYA